MARKAKTTTKTAKSYRHPDADSPMRPEVGTQTRFNKRQPPKTYRYDSSLSPSLEYDGQNHARELGEWLLKQTEEAAALPAPHRFARVRTFETQDKKSACSVGGLQDAVAALKALGKPFLNWAGKAERLSFDVPTMPLFVHERLSTKAILETLRGHKIVDQFDLFGDPQHPIADQVLRAYEHRDKWVNRMILGDSLVVMNSLLGYESLGGQVQMIYMDPPYGVRFGSNFQPFIRKRDVSHSDDADMTREPEMVQAYRDTWELGLHSYLSYLKDRFRLGFDLLHPSGSIFVQINDQNAHHVREVLDDVFHPKNFVSQITFQKTSGFETETISTLGDFILWYAKDAERVKVQKLFEKQDSTPGEGNATWLILPSGEYRGVTAEERRGKPLPEGARLYKPDNILSQGAAREPQPYVFQGKKYEPSSNSHWKANYPKGMDRLAQANRLHVAKNSLQYRRFADDFPYKEIGNIWTDTKTGNFTEDKIYAVQTAAKVIERCLLLTTAPGDLVFDPTCGSGTTAYVAEQWGRRWMTADTSRVPLALARQRLLTATYPWYQLKDEARGPSSGFVYEKRQNKQGEDVGGIVPHVMLESIANGEFSEEEVLVDRPEELSSITRVTGPFCVEATIPTATDSSIDTVEHKDEETASFPDRMLEILRRSPVIRLPGNRTLNLKNVRQPAKTLSLSAEAMVDATANSGKATIADAFQEAREKSGNALPLSQKSVAIVFGPENGAVSERLVDGAAREAYQKGYAHLYVIGFQIEPTARLLIEKNAEMGSILATYIQATTDLTMGDLLKNMRSSQIFSVCGMPEVKLTRLKSKLKSGEHQYKVSLLGLDVFDPVSMDVDHKSGNDVPAWFLDANYNGLCFHVSQAFFPRTGAWESLKKALKGEYADTVWDHLAGNESAPFEVSKGQQIAVKVIDDRGNELMVVVPESEAVPE